MNDTLRIKTEPTAEPVSVDEFRAQNGIRESNISRNAVISNRITAARKWVESYCNIAIITQTWTLYSDELRDVFDLKGLLQSVSSVKYIDTNGIQQTLASDQYYVDLVNSRLHKAYNVNYPDVRGFINSVEIEFICGYGLAASVPNDIKEAIMFIVGHWENYQSNIEGAVRVQTIPYAVMQLLDPYIDYRKAF